MNKYIKDDKIIEATEKAYNCIYKEQGYKEVEEKKEEVKDISKMKKEDLLAYAIEKGIEIPTETTKVEDIRKFIKEIEEKKEEADK